MTNFEFNNDAIKPTARWQKLLRFRVVVPAIVVLTLLMSPFAYRSYYLSGVPEIDPPFDVETFGTVNIPANENAYHDYKLAVSKLVDFKSAGSNDLDVALAGEWADATPDVRLWLEDNQEALALWKVGTEKPDYQNETQPKDYDIASLLPVAQEVRSFARLAVLQGKRLEAEGKFEEAWAWNRALFRSSRHLGQHGCLIEHLVGIAIHAIAVKSILDWATHPEVTSSQLQTAIDNVTDDFELTAPNSTALKIEHITVKNTLDKYADLSNAFSFSHTTPTTAEQILIKLHFYCKVEPQLSLLLNRHLTQNLLMQVDEPRHLRKMAALSSFALFDNSSVVTPAGKTLTAAELEEAILRSSYFKDLMPSYSAVFVASDRCQTKQNILVVVLAAEKYKRVHSQFPPDAAALIKESTLQDMPLDALQTTKSTIQYRNSNSCVTVYSLGEDGIDDRGCSAQLVPTLPGDYGYVLYPVVKQNQEPSE